MPKRGKTETPILAAGGIVTRGEAEKLVAVVQLRKNRDWMLPKGKLDRGEDAVTAAEREVREETGHAVTVHDHLGTLSYRTSRGPKRVDFWHMTATNAPPRKLARDVRRVEWLPPAIAIEKLTLPRERAFLREVAPAVFGQPIAAPPRAGPLVRLWRWLRGLFGA
jgi:8-oxo-dGTP diphosphatase